MYGYSTLRERWETKWGPEPVLALCGAGERAAPITLPGRDTARRDPGAGARVRRPA